MPAKSGRIRGVAVDDGGGGVYREDHCIECVGG